MLNAVRAIVISAMLTHAASYAYVIETVSKWNGADDIHYLGNPIRATATYGQTFEVPVDSALSGWSFWLSNHTSDLQTSVRIDAYLSEWSGDRAIVPTLFQSQGLLVPTSPRGEFHEVHLSVPDVPLSAGRRYVMFLNTSEYETPQSPLELAALGATGNAYAGGDFWYQNSNNLLSNVFSFPWTCADEGSGCRYGDTAFRATLYAVPEPSSVALCVTALFAVGVSGVRTKASR